MPIPTCNSCIHYRQHYSLDNERIFQVYCGHCTISRSKKKLPDAKACERYVHKEANTSFVTKEYLSKALLEYILRLDLLPEIDTLTQNDHTLEP